MTSLQTLVARDFALTLVSALLWAATLQAAGSDTPWALLLDGLTGLMTVLLGYLLHEWGHLAGAWASRSVVHFPKSALSSPFLFRFDTGRNSRRQFLVMSAGGFIASALVVAALLMALPMDRLAGRVALSLTLLGVLATFILEIPPTLKVYRGGELPRGIAFVNSKEQ